MRQSSVRGDRTRRRRPDAQDPAGDGPYESGLPPDAPGWTPPPGSGSVPPDDEGGGSHRKGGRPRRRKGRKVLRWTAISLALLLVAGAGGGYLYYEHLNSKLRKDRRDLSAGGLKKPDPNAFGQSPLNILLLGSDGRDNKENIKLGGARQDADRKPLADVQMLLHVSADRTNMSVISIPRDTRVPIPKCTDPHDGKVYPQTTAAINQSLQHGGPGCTLATWQELTGIYIDHFMMVDFSGVVEMADAIGGVPVCVDKNIYSHDRKGHGSGLRLTEGTHSVKGVQALQWLRTRYGFEDNTDIGRAKAQHMYMNSMVRQLKAGTKLTNPGQLRDLAEAATAALTVDDGLGSVKKLYDLGGDLQRVPTKRITMVTMPWQYGPGESYVMPKPGEAEQTFALLRNDTALDGKDAKKKPSPAPKPVDSQERAEGRRAERHQQQRLGPGVRPGERHPAAVDHSRLHRGGHRLGAEHPRPTPPSATRTRPLGATPWRWPRHWACPTARPRSPVRSPNCASWSATTGAAARSTRSSRATTSPTRPRRARTHSTARTRRPA